MRSVVQCATPPPVLLRHLQHWAPAVRLARKRWPRLPLWAWVRAGYLETPKGPYDPVTPAEAGSAALDVLLALAERARAGEGVTERRNRDVPGWSESLRAARETWPWVSEEAWDAAGDAPARAGRDFVCSQNELCSEVAMLGLDDPPGRR